MVVLVVRSFVRGLSYLGFLIYLVLNFEVSFFYFYGFDKVCYI